MFKVNNKDIRTTSLEEKPFNIIDQKPFSSSGNIISNDNHTGKATAGSILIRISPVFSTKCSILFNSLYHYIIKRYIIAAFHTEAWDLLNLFVGTKTFSYDICYEN